MIPQDDTAREFYLTDEVIAAWDALPAGNFEALYQGKRWGVTRTVRSGGRQGWIWAEERGGTGRISGNVYRLKSGAQLKPCEMPAQHVIDFIMQARRVSERN